MAPRVSSGWPDGFAQGRANRMALLVLSSLRGLTPRKLLELAEVRGTASACLAAVRSGRAGSQPDQQFARELDPEAIWAALTRFGARFAPVGSEAYPPGLGQLSDPPAAIFVYGRPLPEIGTSVAIVGARSCSDLGVDLARSIGRGLAGLGVTVVSGAARGIDAAAHEGALQAAGFTVAVLGCGIDIAYPRGSRGLIARIAATGTVVSEYPPGVPPEPFRFPARNRIIAALVGSLVVVEGAAGSGSLISADHALDLGRAVYAIPGAVNNPLAAVPLSLIREGAVMIRGVEDLFDELRLSANVPIERKAPAELGKDEAAVVRRLSGPVLPETVARDLGVSVPETLAILVGLELKGVVRSVGGRFELRHPV